MKNEILCTGTKILFCDISSGIPWSEERYSSILLIADPKVYTLFGSEIEAHFQHFPFFKYFISSEENKKTLETLAHCWQFMHSQHLDRKSLIISFGGGVISDIAGFAASCYMRGIDVIHIPTTLLGMVDASIGGKTAVNLLSGKNIIGTFYPAKSVLIDVRYLETLPQREFSAGLAEVIKAGMIRPSLFTRIEKEMDEILALDKKVLLPLITDAISVKSTIVNQDEKESGIRSFLNYGHTFGHAIETATRYQSFLHGEAVSIGMTCAILTSRLLNLVDDALVQKQISLCRRAGLPVALPAYLNEDNLLNLMKGDKKSTGGEIQLVLSEGLGKIKCIKNVDQTILRSALKEAKKVLND